MIKKKLKTKIACLIVLFSIIFTFTSYTNSLTNYSSFYENQNVTNIVTLWEKEFRVTNRQLEMVDINGDGILDIIFIDDSNYLRSINGKTGEQIWVSNYLGITSIETSPTIVDIDNDSKLEILFSDFFGQLYCYDHEGELEWNRNIRFPITAQYDIRSTSFCVFDIDNDNSLDLIIGTTEGVICLSSNTMLKWKFDCGDVICTPSVLNMDGDAEYEVVFTSIDGNLYCLDDDGMQKWKYAIYEESDLFSSPTIDDIDFDGKEEIIVGTGNDLRCFEVDGTLKWSYNLGGTYNFITSSPAIANLDNKGSKEIIIEDNYGEVYCFGADGGKNWSKNYGTNYQVKNPIIADINNDNKLEVISVNYQVFIINYLGEEIATYPLSEWTFASPIVGDFNCDNKTEIVFSDYLTKLTCVGFEGFLESGKIYWPCYKATNYHSGFIDQDCDLIDDGIEDYYKTNKSNSDTDFDTFLDGWEIMVGLNPNFDDRKLDMDGDGLTNFEEAKIYHTSIFYIDTDGDGISDFDELIQGRDPLNNDEQLPTITTGPNTTMIVSISIGWFFPFAFIIYFYYRKNTK